ncbi:Lrp/AsnC family transcriptional regulator, partial [archaeon]|nr:Lrp/AsnC family transcriptional regulator [archaeon]
KVEKGILSYLDIDSRTSFSRIGKKIRKSQQQVSYTVQSLKDKEILKGFYTLMDYSKINYNLILFRVYFKVIYTKEQTYENLIEYLKNDPHTGLIEECWGNYDLVTTYYAKNASHFNKHIREVMEKFPKHLQNFSVLTTVVQRHFGRKYLNPKATYDEIFVGGDRVPQKVEDIDLKILNMISTNARINSVEIASILDVTPKTIINRLKKLEEKEIILGYKPLINIRNVGYYSNLLLIKYHNITAKTEKEFINYLKAHPSVISVIKTLGEWDIEIRIEIEDYNQIRKTEREIRENFGSMIQTIQNLPTHKIFKNNFFPSFLLE